MLFVFTAASPYVTVAEVTTLVYMLSFKLAVRLGRYPPLRCAGTERRAHASGPARGTPEGRAGRSAAGSGADKKFLQNLF